MTRARERNDDLDVVRRHVGACCSERVPPGFVLSAVRALAPIPVTPACPRGRDGRQHRPCIRRHEEPTAVHRQRPERRSHSPDAGVGAVKLTRSCKTTRPGLRCRDEFVCFPAATKVLSLLADRAAAWWSRRASPRVAGLILRQGVDRPFLAARLSRERTARHVGAVTKTLSALRGTTRITRRRTSFPCPFIGRKARLSSLGEMAADALEIAASSGIREVVRLSRPDETRLAKIRVPREPNRTVSSV